MSLVLQNQRVFDFYSAHPEFDFEKMNILLVDLLENFKESLSPSLNPTFAAKLAQQIKDLEVGLKVHQVEHYKNVMEFRNQYMEDLKQAIYTNHNEKVQPLLSIQTEMFYEKLIKYQKENSNTNWSKQCDDLKSLLRADFETFSTKDNLQMIEYRLMNGLSSTESRIQVEIKENSRKIESLSKQNYDQEAMHGQIKELLRKMDNSSSKGKVSETVLGHVIHHLYPMGEVKVVGTIKESGDILMLREGFPTILFENKNYDRNVGQDEVQKFLRDVESQQCCGILLAQNYGIANKSNFEIHIYQGHVCVYLHSVQYNPDKIKAAVDIIDHLSSFLGKASSLQSSDDIVLDLEFIEKINREYQQFILQKLTQIKTIKDYSHKMLAQMDEMKFPQMEQWLNKYFSQSLSTTESRCKFCGFEAKSSGGLVSHIRACKKRKADEVIVI